MGNPDKSGLSGVAHPTGLGAEIVLFLFIMGVCVVEGKKKFALFNYRILILGRVGG
jgi:hypothetical protein